MVLRKIASHEGVSEGESEKKSLPDSMFESNGVPSIWRIFHAGGACRRLLARVFVCSCFRRRRHTMSFIRAQRFVLIQDVAVANSECQRCQLLRIYHQWSTKNMTLRGWFVSSGHGVYIEYHIAPTCTSLFFEKHPSDH